MIEIRDITVRFENKTPLENFSLSIARGEKYILEGVSGKGKSTLLKSILGFVELSQGEIICDGVKLSKENLIEYRSRIAYLPQSLNLDFETLEDLIYYPFSFEINKPLRPSFEQIEKIFSLLKLNISLLKQNLNEISGGEKQRAIFASIMLLKRPIVLLDEPASSLDSVSAMAVWDYIYSQKDTTFICVTHNDIYNK